VIECVPDANIYDLIVEREGMLDALELLRSAGRLELVSIREIKEQLTRAPEVKARGDQPSAAKTRARWRICAGLRAT
jgi:hypothetical protein